MGKYCGSGGKLKGKTYIKAFIFLSILLIPLVSFAYENEPDGFRGIKWGTDKSELKDLNSYGTDDQDGTEMFVKKTDELQIGDAKLEHIFYVFWKNKFSGVMIKSKGYSNCRDLKQATFAKFGKGSQDNQFIEKYVWYGTTTTIILNYNEISEEGTLLLISMELRKQQEEYKQKKAKEGAEKDF